MMQSQQFLTDEQIIALYFDRKETAIGETERKYGSYLLTIAQNILNNREDSEECANDTYLKTSGDEAGAASYDQVTDLLVSWHIQQVVIPSQQEDAESVFDPYDETQVDLSGIVNALDKVSQEDSEDGE